MIQQHRVTILPWWYDDGMEDWHVVRHQEWKLSFVFANEMFRVGEHVMTITCLLECRHHTSGTLWGKPDVV